MYGDQSVYYRMWCQLYSKWVRECVATIYNMLFAKRICRHSFDSKVATPGW